MASPLLALPAAGSAPGVGLMLSAVTAIVLVLSANAKLIARSPAAKSAIARFGYPSGTVTRVAVVELLCTALYVFTPTSAIGAILVTGYLGGAVATHVRLADRRFVPPLLLAICAWGGLYLRDERLQFLVPQ